MVQVVEALRYKSEGRGFDSRWCHGKFNFTYYFRPHYGSVSNTNYYQKNFLQYKDGRCAQLTPLPHSRADCLEIFGA